jgi:hypothetical protein
MISRILIRLTVISLFTALATPLRLAAQGRLAGQTPNPVPLINQPLVPDAAVPGGKGFTLTVNGTGFVSGSVVNWDGSGRATTFVSSSQLTASILDSDIRKASTAAVTVVSPERGSGASNTVFFGIGLASPGVGLNASNFGPSGYFISVATGDFNRDGKLDLAVANYTANNVTILLGNGDGTFKVAGNYGTGTSAHGVAVADFNGDGKLDLAVTNEGSNDISILLGNGDGTFKDSVNYAVGSFPWRVAVGDFNSDGKLDLVVTNSAAGGGTPSVSILLGKGDGSFQAALDYGAGTLPFGVAVGDFNRDGTLDLAVGNGESRNVSILLGNGDGTFQSPVNYDIGDQPTEVAAADLNADGELDLAVADTLGHLSVLLGNGDGTFQSVVNYAATGLPISVVVGDFNDDGKLDVVLANQSGINLFLGNGDGTFGPAASYGRQSQNDVSLAVGDFNGDGRLDLALANYSNGVSEVSVLSQIPTVTLSPSKLDFDLQVVGTKSALEKSTLTNGGLPLNISSIAITGPDATDFFQKNNCDSNLPPAGRCTISVAFRPTQIGPRTASVTIIDNAAGSPQSVLLGGIGVTAGPDATLSTKNLTFATQLVGTISAAKPLKLINYGAETLNITSIVAIGDFSEKDNCGSSLPPGGHCNIDVSFKPTQRGHRAGFLSITDNAPDSPQEVHLSGVGTVVRLDPESLDFGTVSVGQKSSPQKAQLTNVGPGRLHIASIRTTGADAGDFPEVNDCPKYLDAKEFCAVTVTFAPTYAGNRSADVSVSDDGGGSPQQLTLSGIGGCGGSCPCAAGCRCAFNRCFIGISSAGAVTESASREACNANRNWLPDMR